MNYGIINSHKPSGPTSRDCVNQLARVLGTTKVAHAGTLDPLASGVLLLLVGPAVRLMDEIHQLDKEYEATFRLGVRSPSYDLESELEEVEIPESCDASALQAVLTRFVGQIEQTPPPYSAVRVQGKRAHELARKGRAVEMPTRSVTVHRIDWLGVTSREFSIRVTCSTGTYLRTLGSDMARSVGTDAVMTSLVRTRIGPFRLQDAVGYESLCPPGVETASKIASDAITANVLPAQMGLPAIPHRVLGQPLLRRILDGQRLTSSELCECEGNWEALPATPGSSLAALDDRNILRALVRLEEDGRWKCSKGIAHWDILP